MTFFRSSTIDILAQIISERSEPIIRTKSELLHGRIFSHPDDHGMLNMHCVKTSSLSPEARCSLSEIGLRVKVGSGGDEAEAVEN